jgi:AraC-like DNA-binding protein
METIEYTNSKYYELEIHSTNLHQKKVTTFFYFYKTIREWLFIHLFICIKHYKLEQAAHRLLTTHDSLEKIAARTGFRNIDKFNKYFTAHFKITPKEFAKKYQITI